MDLDGAHVVITGASRGIGAAMADEFAARGAHCTVVARSADALAAVAERTGGNAFPADLADPDVTEDLIARIEDAHGPVDVLVNNAGIDMTGALADMRAEDVDRQIRLNVLAVTELTRQVLPGMLDRGRGHVVQVSSLAGTGTFPGFAVYGGTKAYLTHMTFGLRMDLKGTPIGLTTVETGLVTPTDMADSVLSYEPTAASFRRFYRLGLLADVPVTTVARRSVRAVEKGRRTVRLPGRAFLFPWLSNAPRRMCELLLAGVPRRGRVPAEVRERVPVG
jgi:short-subunit dehydrogenase